MTNPDLKCYLRDDVPEPVCTLWRLESVLGFEDNLDRWGSCSNVLQLREDIFLSGALMQVCAGEGRYADAAVDAKTSTGQCAAL